MNTKSKKSPFYYGLAGLLSCSLLLNGANSLENTDGNKTSFSHKISNFFTKTTHALVGDYVPQFTQTMSSYDPSDFVWDSVSNSNVVTYAGYTFTQTAIADDSPVAFTKNGEQTVEVKGSITGGLTITPTDSTCKIHVTMANDWATGVDNVISLTVNENVSYENEVSYPFATEKKGSYYSIVQLYFKGDDTDLGFDEKNPACYVIEDLSVYRNGGAIATRGNVELALSGENYVIGNAYGVTSVGNLTFANSDPTKLAKEDQGILEVYTQVGTALRPGSVDSHTIINGGYLKLRGEYAIGVQGRLAPVTFNGGYFHGIGYNYAIRSSVSSADATDDDDFGTVTINGGEIVLETTHAVSGAHTIEGKIVTGDSSDGKNAGVLVINSNLFYPDSVDVDDWNLLLMDTREASDPFHTYWPESAMPIYNWNDGGTGGSGTSYDRQYGRIYGDVALAQPFTMEDTWILDIPVGTSFRHTDEVDGTGTSYLTMEGSLDDTIITNKSDFTADTVYNYKYAVIRFMGEYLDEDGIVKETAPPFLWSNSTVAPQGNGQIQLIMTDTLIDNTSASNKKGSVANLVDGVMEYNGGSINYITWTENGYGSFNTGTHPVSIKYLKADGSSGPGAATTASVGSYQTYLSLRSYNVAMDDNNNIHTHVIGIASKPFTITPFDIGVLGSDDTTTYNDKTYSKTMEVSVTYNEDSSPTTKTYRSTDSVPSGDLQMDYSVDGFDAENALSLDIMGNLTEDSIGKITVESNLETLTYGTDYYFTYERYKDVDGKEDLGVIELTVVGIGSYTGELKETIKVSVYTDILASLGSATVEVQVLDTVYQKPDGTIDISGLALELVTNSGNTKLELDTDYTITYGEANGLNYPVTITSMSDGGATLSFTVQAKAAGTGEEFEAGLIYLVEPFYERPDGKVYPEDLTLYGNVDSDGNTGASYEKRQLVLGEDYFLSATLTVEGSGQTFFATGALTVYDDIAFDTEVFNQSGAELKVTAYFMTSEKDEDYSEDDFETVIADLDQVSFAIEYIKAGKDMISSDLSTGTLEEYEESSEVIYIAKIDYGDYDEKYFPLDISGLGLVATVPDGTDTGGGTIDHTLTTSDISYVTTYDFSVDTEKYSSIRKSTYFDSGMSNTGFGKDLWYLTVVGTGDFRGSVTFTVPNSRVVIVEVDKSVQEQIKGTFDGHYILAVDDRNLYVKPDGTLHLEDIVISYISTEVEVDGGGVATLKTKILPTSSYNLGIGVRAEKTKDGDVVTSWTYPLTMSNSSGATFEELQSLKGEGLSVEAQAAGTGDYFRYGYLDEVYDLDLMELMTYVDGGKSHAPDNGEGFTEDDVKDVLHHVKDHWDDLDLKDYDLSFKPSFYGSDLYEVTATLKAKTSGDPLDTGIDHDLITFDLQIDVPYVVTFFTNHPSDSYSGDDTSTYLGNLYLEDLDGTNGQITFPKDEPTLDGYTLSRVVHHHPCCTGRSWG